MVSRPGSTNSIDSQHVLKWHTQAVEPPGLLIVVACFSMNQLTEYNSSSPTFLTLMNHHRGYQRQVFVTLSETETSIYILPIDYKMLQPPTQNTSDHHLLRRLHPAEALDRIQDLGLLGRHLGGLPQWHCLSRALSDTFSRLNIVKISCGAYDVGIETITSPFSLQ